ncbi:MAG: TadE/TadG family type IV pilus assembly protein [Hyphomonadaceae bacterium]
MIRAPAHRSFARARGGIAAVEFALILPVLVLLFFGLIELSEGTAVRGRMETTVSTVSDLVAQANKITNNERDNIFNAAKAIMYPYSATGVGIRISSLIDDGTGKGKVQWSDAQNWTALAVNTVQTVPAGVIATGGTVILAEVKYTYTSPLKYVLPAPVDMSSKFYSRPRRTVAITRSAT